MPDSPELLERVAVLETKVQFLENENSDRRDRDSWSRTSIKYLNSDR